MRSGSLVFLVVALVITFHGACGKNNSGSGSSNNATMSGGNGGLILKPTANFKDAASLFVVDPSQKSGAALVEEHNKTAALIGANKLQLSDIDFSDLEHARQSYGLADTSTSTDGTNSLQKSDANGNISNALTATSKDPNGGSTAGQTPPSLPKILTLAVSPAPYNEIFIHFEQAFRFTAPTTTTVQTQGDPRSDGSYCQLFRVSGGSVDDLQKTAPSAENLECIDPNHFINNWNAYRLSVFQFDSSGNVYFPGGIPNSPKLVVYKWDRSTKALTEMINSNICVQDFLVMKSGSIFYTGTSSCNGAGGPSGGFFRYLTTTGLTEIARNWYSFIYEASTTATGDQSVFFGPDPTASGTASWNSACLFRFDPSGGDTTAKRTSKVITCGDNIWDWIQMRRAQDKTTFGTGFENGGDATDAYKTELSTRCTSSGQIFAGGGSQISSIKQDSTGQVYIIGNVRKKNAGEMTCSVEIRGPHCKDTDGDPDPDLTTIADCKADGGTWVDEGFCDRFTLNGTITTTPLTSSDCFQATNPRWTRNSVNYNSASGTICTKSGAITQANWWGSDSVSFQRVETSLAHVMKFRLNNMHCEPPTSAGTGDQWTSEYQGLGKVNSTTQTLSLLSGTDEQAISLWVINDVVYYSAFNSTSGRYSLRMWNGTSSVTMVDNFETYHLNTSVDSTKLYYDGLDFSDNTYNFGTVLVASPYTREKNVGLTGALKMVVIMP